MIEFRERVVRDVYVHGFRVDLAPQELAALLALKDANGGFIDRRKLTHVIGTPDGSKTTDVVLCHLREKLEDHGLPGAIETKRGKGWRLRA